METNNGHLLARQNEVTVLYWIARMGWATPRDLGRLVWHTSNSEKQRRAAAGRTLSRLVDAQEVLRRTLPTGGTGYVVAQRGAHRLHEHGHYWAQSGHKRRLDDPHHSHLANAYLIDQHQAGRIVRFEHEIRRRLSPARTLAGTGQIADGYAINPDPGDETALWIEAERSWKSHDRRRRLLRVADALNHEHPVELGTDSALGTIVMLEGMVFISSDQAALDRIGNTMIEALEGGRLTETALHRIHLVPVEHSERLVYSGVTGSEKTVAELYWGW